MNRGEICKLGRHWLYCGDPDNYDNIYEAVMQTYSSHYIDILADPFRVNTLLWEGQHKKSKAYPKAREYADRWNSLARNDRWVNVEDSEALAGIIEDLSEEGDVLICYWVFAAEILTACEATGRIALIMKESPEGCKNIKSKWLAITKGDD